MNFETAPPAIKAYFAQQWGNRTAVIYDDVNGEVPDASFVRLNIRHVDGFQASMGSPGSNRFRRFGNLTAQVFVKQGDANREAAGHAQLISQIFRNLELNGITFYNTHIREVGPDGRGFNQINVNSSFRYDEIA